MSWKAIRIPESPFFPRENEYFPADILGIQGGDPRGVAALIVKAANLPPGIRAFTISSNANVRGGEAIKVIGFPREVAAPWLIVDGSIGGRTGSDIAFSAAIGEGNSGGPLLLNSRVIGIVSQMGSTVGYAVPITTARFALEGWGVEFTEGDNALLPKEIIDKDGMTSLLVYGGEFPMGGQQLFTYIDAFYIDKMSADGLRTWNAAANYCVTRSKRLPTEAEWEKAVRAKVISPIVRTWEWVADWYQSDYARIRPSRNPTGPSVGESNELQLAQWGNRLRADAESWAEFLCRVPDECKNLKPGEACWKSPCSDAQRRSSYDTYLQGHMSTRPATDMKKVIRLNADSRDGRFSRAEEFGFRCVREPAP